MRTESGISNGDWGFRPSGDFRSGEEREIRGDCGHHSERWHEKERTSLGSRRGTRGGASL